MSAIIGNGVTLRGYHFEDFMLTTNLAAGITKADEGKLVTLDTSASTTMKLAGINDRVFGRLEVVEDRTVEGLLVGTVAGKFANKVPISAAAPGTVAVGDVLEGSAVAGQGQTKGGGSPTASVPGNLVVVELIDANTVIATNIY
jgi:hypothetical protein